MGPVVFDTLPTLQQYFSYRNQRLEGNTSFGKIFLTFNFIVDEVLLWTLRMMKSERSQNKFRPKEIRADSLPWLKNWFVCLMSSPRRNVHAR